MKSTHGSRVAALAGALLVFAACSDSPQEQSSSSGSSSGGGGAEPIEDIPCQDKLGCAKGDAQLKLHCTAPDDGSGVTTWDVTAVAGLATMTGRCYYQPDAGQLRLVSGDSDTLVAFTGGGSYPLGLDSHGTRELSILGHGKRGNSSNGTLATSTTPCSAGCVMDVLPKDRPLGGPDTWTTYRFVITCHDPLAELSSGCGQCTLAPSSYTIDAACYVPPKGG